MHYTSTMHVLEFWVHHASCRGLLVYTAILHHSHTSMALSNLPPLFCTPGSPFIHVSGFHPEKICWGGSCIQKSFLGGKLHAYVILSFPIKVTHIAVGFLGGSFPPIGWNPVCEKPVPPPKHEPYKQCGRLAHTFIPCMYFYSIVLIAQLLTFSREQPC